MLNYFKISLFFFYI